jgi:hypothetical protein
LDETNIKMHRCVPVRSSGNQDARYTSCKQAQCRDLFSNTSSGCKRVVRKALFYRPTGEEVKTYGFMESKLYPFGWERCNPSGFKAREYCQPYGTTKNTMVLPHEFRDLSPIKMYEISVQSRTAFEVKEFVEIL